MKKIKQSDSKFCKNTRIVSYGLNLDICNKYETHNIFNVFSKYLFTIRVFKMYRQFLIISKPGENPLCLFSYYFFFTITELYILPYNPV